MSRSMLATLLALAATLAVPAAVAQSLSPASANAPPVILPYTSALADYRGYADQPLQSWKAANDTVGRIGGWRVYAREAARGGDPNSNASSAKPVNQAPAAQPSGHKGH